MRVSVPLAQRAWRRRRLAALWAELEGRLQKGIEETALTAVKGVHELPRGFTNYSRGSRCARPRTVCVGGKAEIEKRKGA